MDAKITALDANTTPASTDLTVIVDDPGGTPATQKMTIDTLDDYFSATTKTLTNKTLTNPTITTPIVTTAVNLSTLGATETVNWASGDLQAGTLDENVTLTFSNAVAGQRLTLFLLQDGTGTNTITFADTIVWQDATTPTWTITADKMNVMVIYYSGSAYFGMGGKFV